MSSLTIRNFDDQLKALLRLQAVRHGCSMEQEARDILSRAIQASPKEIGFAQKINQCFAGLQADDFLSLHVDSALLISSPDKGRLGGVSV